MQKPALTSWWTCKVTFSLFCQKNVHSKAFVTYVCEQALPVLDKLASPDADTNVQLDLLKLFAEISEHAGDLENQEACVEKVFTRLLVRLHSYPWGFFRFAHIMATSSWHSSVGFFQSLKLYRQKVQNVLRCLVGSEWCIVLSCSIKIAFNLKLMCIFFFWLLIVIVREKNLSTNFIHCCCVFFLQCV